MKQAILEGRLEPGQKLVALQIAEEMGVSRMPVREALKRLEAEGFVFSSPHKEAVVADLSPEDIERIYEIRRVLEAFAIRKACLNITENQIKELERIVEEAEVLMKRGEDGLFQEKNDEFHFALFEAADNDKLAQILTNLWEQCKYYRALGTVLKGKPEVSLAEHRGIIKAIRDGDPDTAERILMEHTNRPANALVEFLKMREAGKRRAPAAHL